MRIRVNGRRPAPAAPSSRAVARHFTNLDGRSRVVSPLDILKWQLGLHGERRPKTPSTGVPVPALDNDGRALVGAPRESLTWIGHATFLIQLGGKSVLVDPVLSNRIGFGLQRNVAPGLSWSALPKVDVVLVTHNHRDHMDAPTLQRLGPDPVYVVPRGLGAWFSRRGLTRVTEMDWWQESDVEGLRVTFVPSEHWSRRGLSDTNQTWWGGYVVEAGGARVYHSGDTACFDGFEQIRKRCPPIDVAMLPIGAYAPRWFMKRQHMNPEDALEAFRALGARRLVAMHWGTFKLTDEPLLEPPALLTDLWQRSEFPKQRLSIPAIGETLLLDGP